MDLSKVKTKYPGSQTFIFGDNKELCEELTLLVVSGAKVATCDSYSNYQSGKEMMPVVGRIDIALTWDGQPAVAIRTVEIEIKQFNEIEEEFALDEGENDSLEGWRNDHKAYFERNGGFTPEMKVICERFEVVETFI